MSMSHRARASEREAGKTEPREEVGEPDDGDRGPCDGPP